MFIVVPKRYDTPKWQAPVIPADHAFIFADGTAIRTLFELKQALTTLDDHVIYQHVQGDRNDLASWVEHCVGDQELAQAFRSQNHRWGMIVTLERQMMRTLNLPPYVVSRWLSALAVPFTFVSGETVHSLTELKQALTSVSDDTVAFHLERYPNDLAQWVQDAAGDYELADLLTECTTRIQMANYTADHLEMLADAVQ
jgi:hypothetical protein